MKNLDFEWLTDEFMLYCRSTQLREKTVSSYEQTLHLFGRWLSDELKIYTVDKITENVIRKYIDDLMVRGKTYRQVEAMTGISKSTLIRVKKV